MPYPGPDTYPGPGLFPTAVVEEDGYVMQTIVGAELAEQLYWLPGDETLQWYLDAIGALFQETAAITHDIGTDGEPGYQTGYGSIFTVNPRFPGDTAICPTELLPFVGQFVGVPIPPSADDAAARSLITSEQGLQRGSPSAIVAAAKRFLTDTQTVTNEPQVTPSGQVNPFYFTLVVRLAEVLDGPSLAAAVEAVKPAWMQWALVFSDGTPWYALPNAWSTYKNTWNSFASTQSPMARWSALPVQWSTLTSIWAETAG
jgi:hypothetical protein